VSEQEPTHTQVAIVGAGFGGLGMAAELVRAGRQDFVVLERNAEVGGTWLANTYPGCQCDVPSNLYSFSFAAKSDWTHAYPEQSQILDYLRGTADAFGVRPHLRLNCDVTNASWDDERAQWRIETSQGPFTAQVLIAAPGLLSEPRVPQGFEAFEGEVFHSARWDHSATLAGKRVGMVGTGASAIQIGPRIQPDVERLTVFQRTAPWIIPHPDREIPGSLQKLYARVPALQKLARAGVYALHETIAPGLTYAPRLMKVQGLTAKALMRAQIKDPALRARVTPDYEIGCKRILLSSDWYPMLQEPNVDLVTAGIDEVRAHSIVTSDGVEHQLDALVLATGFDPVDIPLARRLHGREGRSLHDVWGGSPRAYLGTAVAGFPNLFLVYGPNINLGHTSMVYMLESQMRYVVQALDRLDRMAVLEVRPEVVDRYNEDLQRQLRRSVWNNGGCSSWYLDKNGHNSIQWPGFTFSFRLRTREFELSDYTLRPAPALQPA
jgi:cation diffusion facilitator CzcD-associated flavoprotein CzcO